MAAEHLFIDPVGNRLIVRPLTDRTVTIEIVDEDRADPVTVSVIITPDELQAIADAAKRTAAEPPILIVRSEPR
jgi:hypothetical protein